MENYRVGKLSAVAEFIKRKMSVAAAAVAISSVAIAVVAERREEMIN